MIFNVLLGGATDSASLRCGAGSLSAILYDSIEGAATYSATAHRWWKISRVGNEIQYEVSADARAWTVLHHEFYPGSPTTGIVELGVRMDPIYGGGNGSATFDNLNVCPSP